MKTKISRRVCFTLIAIISVVMAIVIVALNTNSYEEDLAKTHTKFVEMLEEEEGNYNINRLVLSQTTKKEAEEILAITGGKLRITESGDFATITLPDGVNVSDIASNEAMRKYLDKITIDYNNFSTSEINEDDYLEDLDDSSLSYTNYDVPDKLFTQQNYFNYINIGNAWNYSLGKNDKGEKVTVAVIDSGIDTDHPEFFDAEGNSIISNKSYNSTEDKTVEMNDISVIEDENGHGTAVAGVLAAQMNGEGIVGVAPDVELLVIKCDIDEDGIFKSSSDIVFAIYYAIEQDVDVINMSFSGAGSSAVASAIQLAVDSDIIPVAAAGNDSSKSPVYPAAYINTIGVGALESESWEIASYSNYGANSDIMAPGTTLTVQIGGGYTYKNGTSMSAPIVSAACALYKSQNKYATFEEVKGNILAAGRDLGDPGEDVYFGFGALDINAFICEEKGTITYDYCTEEIENTTQVFVRKHTIQTVPEPERDKLVFDDWYYDKAYTRVFDYDNYYSTEFVENVTLYAKWVNEDDEDASVYECKSLGDGTVEIVDYKGKRRYLTIPDTLDGKVVSSIGVSAFAYNTRLREVTFPSGLVYIKESAFNNVSKLRKITFTGESLHEIQEKAFYNCISLSKLDLPDSVAIIEGGAFANCSSLYTVNISSNSNLIKFGAVAFSNTAISRFYIPKNVTESGFNGSVLSGSKKMTTVMVHPENSAFTVDSSTVYSIDKTELVYYPAALKGDYIVDDYVTIIGDSAFAYSSISSLTMPDSVLSIGGFVCSSSKLGQVTLSESLTKISDGAFEFCSNLKQITLPEGLITIEDGAFEFCSNLKQITLPKGLITIEDDAFAYSGLNSIHIPGKVQSIGLRAFYSCSLVDLTFDVKATLKSIGNKAFSKCNQLADFILPDYLVSIGEEAFSYCYSIKNINIPMNVSSIGNEAFRYCTGLKTVTFTEGCVLTELADHIFANCTSLQTVTLSDNISVIGDYAFNQNISLTTLNFTESSTLKTVDTYAFYGCTSLKTTQLPACVVEIDNFAYAFSGLVSLKIDAVLTTVGNAAFGGCFYLTEINVSENNATFAAIDNVLFSKDITTVYCVPSSRVGTYTIPATVKVTAPYSFYYDIYLNTVVLPEGLEDIRFNTFDHCTLLSAIDIPAAVTNIGRQGFYYCMNLKSVNFAEDSVLESLGIYTFVNCGFDEITIPASVTGMGQYVFKYCDNLKKITFAENSRLSYISAYILAGTRVEEIVFEKGSVLTSIQAHAFDGAYYLKTIDFGDAEVTNIDNYAFYNCSTLEGIDVPNTVTYIGRYAFYGCATMSRIDLPAYVDYIGESAFYGTNQIKVFFASEVLPANVQIGWDNGIAGYFLNAKDYIVTDEWEYTITYNDTAVPALYKGSASSFTVDVIDGYIVEKIGTGCFYDNDTITAIVLADTIIEIGNYAFFDCDGLMAITVPDAVTRIGNYSFADSETVVTLSDGSNLETIGNYAFSGNVTTDITLPDSVTTIGEGAFSESELTAITISENSSLKRIGMGAFVDSKIKSIHLPATLMEVGVDAFKGLESLGNVTIDDGDVVLKLSNSAFEGSGIADINVPSRVYYIGEYTFGSCQNLLNINVHASNTAYIAVDGVLYDSTGTTLVQYPCGRSGAYEVPAQTKVLTYASFKNAKKLTEVTFAEGSIVKAIGWQTFSGCELLEKITVPATCVSFDFYAFENCTSLTDVIIPDEAEFNGVYEGAFYNCTSLVNIMLPDTVAEIAEYAFYNCTSLTKIPLSENSTVKGIYDYAFYGCSGITEIPVFVNLVEIGDYTFAYTNISEYTVPETVKVIFPNAFSHCIHFENIYCDINNTEYTSIEGILFEKGAESKDDLDMLVLWPYARVYIIGEGKTILTSDDTKKFSYIYTADPIDFKFIEIADTIKSIDIGAFRGCGNLISIKVPEGVTTIGAGAFASCFNLTNIELPNSLVEIHSGAFGGCRSLTSIVIPQGITRIGHATFSGCRNLANIIIPESVSYIDYFAFKSCDKLETAGAIGGKYNIEFGWSTSIPKDMFKHFPNLKSIDIPNKVETIESYAFSNCTNLIKITIPESVTSVGYNAFNGCIGLKTAGSLNGGFNIEFEWSSIPNRAFEGFTELSRVSFSDAVISIGYNSFKDCTGLSKITISNSETIVNQAAFAGCTGLTSAGPIGCGYDYEFAWEYSIPDTAFYGCSGLTNVVIPDSVTSIGEWAFYKCNSLTFITLPKGLTDIKGRAFYACSGLKNIKIPESVTSIGDDVFSGCSSLTTAGPIGGGYDYEFGWTHTIVPNAFAGLKALTDITIPKGITSVGQEAFIGCTNLSSITVDMENTKYHSNSNCLIETLEKKLVLGCKNSIIPTDGSVISIGSYAFADCIELTQIIIPDSVTCIGTYAFKGCTNLVSVLIPESVTEIGINTFYNCTELKTAGPVGECFNIEFEWKSTIPSHAFHGHNCLTSVIIPDGITLIERGAFTGCRELSNITLPNSLSVIGETVFSYCYSLANITIPQGVINIKYNAFEGCNKLTSIEIPESVTSIGNKAFIGCVNLVNLRINSNTIVQQIVQSTSCGYLCYYAETITVPSSVITGEYITDKFIYFENISIEGSVFNTYSKHEHVWESSIVQEMIQCKQTGIINNKCTVCGFDYNETIHPHTYSEWHINIHETCVESGEECRKCINCDYYITREIPATGHSYGEWIITKDPTITEEGIKTRKCENCELKETEVIPILINGVCGDNLIWYIKDSVLTISGTGDMYERLYHMVTWQDYKKEFDKVVIENGVTNIGDYAFASCSNILSVVLPETLKTIEDSAFLSCTHLTSITIPKSVWKINHSAFMGCKKLYCVYINSSSIASMIISDKNESGYLCEYAKTIVVPSNIESDVSSYIKDNYTYTSTVLIDQEECNVYSNHEHSWENVIVSEPVECVQDGITNHKCITCCFNYDDIILAHTYGEWYITVAPNCIASGSEQRECDRCDYFETRETLALGHEIIVYEAKIPTCVEVGWSNYEACSRCDYTTYNEIPAAGHTYESIVTAPTCTDQGFTTYTCHCGDNYISDYVDAFGHSFGDWYTTVEPTCVDGGTEQHDCERCDHYESREIEALGHDLIFHEEKGATCTEHGYLAYEECNRCDHTTYVRLPIIDHNYENGACTMCGEKDPTVLKGDIDGNGKVNAVDMFRMKLFIKQILNATNTEVIAADISGDGKINVVDLFELKYRLVKGEWRSKEY